MKKKENNSNGKCITYSQMSLIFNVRLFYRRFSLWIRIYLIDRYYGIGTAEEAFGRLYLEAGNFGDMIRIVFGRRTANAYTQLLSNYAIGIRDLISAQMAGDTAAMNQHLNELYQNIENRAKFLASINPYANEAEWRDLLMTYLQLVIDVANAFSAQDFTTGIKTYDQLTEFTRMLGETFARELYEYITSGSQLGSQPQEGQRCFTYEQMNNIYDIRMFYYDLAYWTRAYMLSRIYGVGDPSGVLARLSEAPGRYIAGLGAIFGTNYVSGDVDLLSKYIQEVDALISAMLAGNTDEVNTAVQNLYRNADERAAFLASINPYWTEEGWRAILYQNIRNLVDELRTFLSSDYARNLDIFDTILDQAEYASEYYTQGLLNFMNRQNEKTSS